MHHTQSNLIEINKKIKDKIKNLSLSEYDPKVIAVSKTFSEEDIMPLIKYGHCDFGENKVQEAQKKWPKLKELHKNLKLHMLGSLQTNKVKISLKIFTTSNSTICIITSLLWLNLINHLRIFRAFLKFYRFE